MKNKVNIIQKINKSLIIVFFFATIGLLYNNSELYKPYYESSAKMLFGQPTSTSIKEFIVALSTRQDLILSTLNSLDLNSEDLLVEELNQNFIVYNEPSSLIFTFYLKGYQSDILTLFINTHLDNVISYGNENYPLLNNKLEALEYSSSYRLISLTKNQSLYTFILLGFLVSLYLYVVLPTVKRR